MNGVRCTPSRNGAALGLRKTLHFTNASIGHPLEALHCVRQQPNSLLVRAVCGACLPLPKWNCYTKLPIFLHLFIRHDLIKESVQPVFWVPVLRFPELGPRLNSGLVSPRSAAATLVIFLGAAFQVSSTVVIGVI